MLYVYLAALLFGGVMIVGSLLFGGEHHDGEIAHVHDIGAEGWLPIGSLRFWNFLLFAFGLTGALFTMLSDLSEGAAAGISAAMGVVSAAAATSALRRLSSRQVSSEVKTEDYVGVTAKALLPMGPERKGKVRVFLKGQAHDLQAVIVGDEEVAPKDEVMIVEANEEVVKVAKVNR